MNDGNFNAFEKRGAQATPLTFAKTFRRGDRVAYTLVDGTVAVGEFVRISRESGFAIVEIGDPDGLISVDFETLRHAPVEVVGPLPAPLPTACPDCGGTLTVDPEARKGTPQPGGRTRYRTVRVAFCGGCEYAVEC